MIPCTPGYICDNTLNGGPVTVPTLLCNSGYYCEQGSDNASKQQCPQGYYCIEGSAEPIPCPAGRYSNSLGLSAENQCTECTANYYCPDIAATAMDFSLMCDPGFTCPAGSVHPRVNICAKGYKCPQTSVDPIACVNPQEYQDRMGATECNVC